MNQDIDFSYSYRVSKIKFQKGIKLDNQRKTITFLEEED